MRKITLLFILFFMFNFSSIFAQQVEKNYVVVEIGTGTWCGYCPGAAMGADDLVANGHQVAIIENHNGDDYDNAYSNARNSYYGITGYPTAFFNGQSNHVGGSATSSIYSSYLPLYNTEIAIMSDFTLDIDYTHEGLDYEVMINVNEVNEYEGENLRIHLVLSESHIPESWGGGLEELNFVNRLMVPNQNGTAYTGGESPLTLNFTADAAWDLFHSELIAFIQDDTTKEILQANKISLAEANGINNAMLFEVQEIDDLCSGVVSPKLVVRNYGESTISSMSIDYSINEGATEGSFDWLGEAFDTFASQTIEMDPIVFDLLDSNTVDFTISSVNDEVDDDTTNNTGNVSFNKVDIAASNPTINVEILTDNYGSETTWELIDLADGSELLSGGPYSNNTLYTESVEIEENGCYSFAIHDAYGDGICCSYGSGHYSVSSGSNILFEGGNFGSFEKTGFVSADNLANDSIIFPEVQIFPNPVNTVLSVVNAKGLNVQLFDVLGREVYAKQNISVEEQISVSNLDEGTYFVKLSNNELARTEKVVITK